MTSFVKRLFENLGNNDLEDSDKEKAQRELTITDTAVASTRTTHACPLLLLGVTQ